MSGKQRILVHSIGSLGDTIVTIPALRVVRRRYGSDAEITLLSDVTQPDIVKAKDVLEGTGLVDKYLEYKIAGGAKAMLPSVFKLWKMLVGGKFDAVVYLMTSERSAKAVQRDELFFKLAGIKNRYGFEPFSDEYLYPRDERGRPKQVPHEAVRRGERLEKYGFGKLQHDDLYEAFLIPPDAASEKAISWLNERRQFPDKVLVGFCPGTKMPSKRWPLDRFEEIGRRLIADGRFEIVVGGGPNDAADAKTLIAAWGQGLNAAGEFSVMGSAALLHQCSFIVSVDSGPMHLAGVGGVPCVSIFSSIDFPGRFSPLGKGHILLRYDDVDCSACRNPNCPVKGHPCMTAVTVEQVWDAVKKVSGEIGHPL